MWRSTVGDVLSVRRLLKGVDAGTVAEHLIHLFYRVGIPKEIFSDQGTNFMSQLLKELYNLLSISQI